MQKSKVVLVAIILVAGFLRFYNLMFGQPFFFNPDERNMASAITRLNFPKDLNPQFFAYGQFPLYLAYFSQLIKNFVTHQPTLTVTFPQAIFWLRFWSALASTLTVLVVYLISKKRLASILVAFTPALIQSSHFGTTESLLTFFFILIIYLSITFKGLISQSIVLGIIIGTAIATKVSAVIFMTIPLFSIFVLASGPIIKKISFCFLVIVFCSLFSIILSPFNIIELPAFKGSMNYESAVALGKTEVFYTKQFENTPPVIFQLQKVFPYALGIAIFIFGVLGIGLSLKNIKKSKVNLILLVSLILYFLPNAFLYAKWTRFMTPIFPIFSIFAVYLIYRFPKAVGLLTIISIFPGLMFFSIYLKPDVRVSASDWIYNNIPSNSYILSETANVIDIPIQIQNAKFKMQNYEVISFNFYDLDENPLRFKELLVHLEKADYIFIPSRRIFANYRRSPDRYPITTKYYDLLFSGKLGFEKVAEFSRLRDEFAEETFTVFDHPVIRIYKKINPLNSQNYNQLFSGS